MRLAPSVQMHASKSSIHRRLQGRYENLRQVKIHLTAAQCTRKTHSINYGEVQ